MPEQFTIKGTTLTLQRADITDLEVEAFVYYARSDLQLGAGFGNAIAVRGGPTIKKELDTIGRREVGSAVVTSAGGLKSKYIVHAVGPTFQEEDTEKKLQLTLVAALKAAQEKGIQQIALPPMGAGFYGIPLPQCAEIMIKTLQEYLKGDSTLKEIWLVANDQHEFRQFKSQFDKLL